MLHATLPEKYPKLSLPEIPYNAYDQKSDTNHLSISRLPDILLPVSKLVET